MKFPIAFSFLVLTAYMVGQIEHAPTVAECQADQRLWLSQIEEGPSKPLPSLDIIQKWQVEMDGCSKVDPSNHLKYYNTSSELDAEQLTRFIHFVKRHGLWSQFQQEDADGKR